MAAQETWDAASLPAGRQSFRGLSNMRSQARARVLAPRATAHGRRRRAGSTHARWWRCCPRTLPSLPSLPLPYSPKDSGMQHGTHVAQCAEGRAEHQPCAAKHYEELPWPSLQPVVPPSVPATASPCAHWYTLSLSWQTGYLGTYLLRMSTETSPRFLLQSSALM